jgi:2,3-bisphosphoglycerate-dependent phosphoglycerate mutase
VLVGVTHESEPEPGTYEQRRFQVPPGATDLLLVRHGQSQAYREGVVFPLVDGHGDPPLSALGERQAALAGARLATAGIDAIYVTTLQRTAQTAAPLAERLGLTAAIEPDLREVNLGDWEGGLYRKMVADNHPIAQQMYTRERWDVIPNAEPADQFASRVRAAIERVAGKHPDQRVAVFTHGGVIGQVLALAARSRTFAFTGSENASISRLVVLGDHWIIRGYNDTSHLDSPETR